MKLGLQTSLTEFFDIFLCRYCMSYRKDLTPSPSISENPSSFLFALGDLEKKTEIRQCQSGVHAAFLPVKDSRSFLFWLHWRPQGDYSSLSSCLHLWTDLGRKDEDSTMKTRTFSVLYSSFHNSSIVLPWMDVLKHKETGISPRRISVQTSMDVPWMNVSTGLIFGWYMYQI